MQQQYQYLVIGDPIAHSRSPQMQNAAFNFYGMGSPYGKLRVDPAKIGEFVSYARDNLAGVNLTVPHKQVVIPFVDELSEEAAACESVNTLKIVDGKVYGYSTDGAGITGAIRSNFNVDPAKLRILMLGAGGAATAIAFKLAEIGVPSLTIANRTGSKAEELAGRITNYRPGFHIDALPLDAEKLSEAAAGADLLIQATSLGLHDDDPPPVDLELLNANRKLMVFDAIYRPTPLLKKAEELGMQFADGKEMLIWQGAASFEIWTGKAAPIEEMRKGFMKNEP